MSKQKKESGAGDTFLAILLTLVIAAAGFYIAPVLVKAAIVTVIVLLLALWGFARAHELTIPAMFGLYLSKGLVAGFKGMAIALAEWPIRLTHRAAIRFEVRLRLELATWRVAYATHRGAVAVACRIGPVLTRRTAAIEDAARELAEDVTEPAYSEIA